MTQKERITQLEREVADLRMLVEALRAAKPFVPYTPPPAPSNPWPNTPWQYPKIIYGTGHVCTPPSNLYVV